MKTILYISALTLTLSGCVNNEYVQCYLRGPSQQECRWQNEQMADFYRVLKEQRVDFEESNRLYKESNKEIFNEELNQQFMNGYKAHHDTTAACKGNLAHTSTCLAEMNAWTEEFNKEFRPATYAWSKRPSVGMDIPPPSYSVYTPPPRITIIITKQRRVKGPL